MAASVIALIAVIISAFFGSLIAEDYRRFRDSQGIAAAIAGELTSYVEGGEVMLRMLAIMKQQTANGVVIAFKSFDPPTDVLYSALAGKIGLLGAAMARDTAYVYQRINGFRVGYMVLTREHSSLTPDAVICSLASCEEMIKEANLRAEPLLKALGKRANEGYTWPRLPKFKPAIENKNN
jgi:hypothetical protein